MAGCPVADYACDVLSGTIPAGRWVKAACRRHLGDLEAGHERGLWWDQDAADHAIKFFSFLRHSKGRWNDAPFVLSPWQSFIVGSLFGWKRADGTRRYRIAFVEVPRKNGKALDVDTPIPTPFGWKRMGDIEAGDWVFAVDGTPTRVVGTSEVMHGRDCYGVEFSDGTHVVADGDHLWETDARTDRDRLRRSAPTIKRTVQIRDTLTPPGRSAAAKGERNHRIRLAAPLQAQHASLPIDPYTLGAWLGDGHSASARLTCSWEDVEILNHVRAAGYDVSFRGRDNRSKACLFLLGSKGRSTRRADALQTRLRAADLLNNKHIPPAYLRASESQRLALLQGLMDTDGSVTAAGQCEFTTTSIRLASDFLELARSLGLKPTAATGVAACNGKVCGEKFRIKFYSYRDRPCFRLARKAARLKPLPAKPTRATTRQIVAVEPVPSRPVKCIAVEHDSHLYLAGRGMVPTHNTTLAAGIGLYLLVCDGEAGAEVYSAATKRDQAKLVFEDAKALVARCKPLADRIERYRYSLQVPATRGKFEPLSSDADSLDGLNPFAAIFDEIHAYKSRDLWDVLLTGMGAREQPLALAITTAGDFTASIYNELRTDAEQILEAVGHLDGVRDDAVFAFVACLDPDDEWTDPRAWPKANPNLGVSLRADELAEVIERAKRQPSSQNKVKRNRLGIRTATLNAWLRLDQWDRGAAPFDPSELNGKPCWGGLDMASTSDLAAFALAFPFADGRGRTCYRLVVQCWCPADADTSSAEKLRRKLFPWAQAGHVEFTPGNAIDVERIEEHVLACAARYDLKALAFDPWNAESTSQRLAAAGVECFKFPQRVGSFHEPVATFERAVIDGRLFHAGNPLLRWMVSNCVLVTNAAGFSMPGRKASRDKIDGLVAAVMAVGCHLKAPAEESSVYETRGFD